jgi:hypothetical protein
MITVRKYMLVAGGALVALVLASHVARADYISPDPRLPSPSHQSTNQVAYATPGGPVLMDSFFDIFYDLVAPPPPGGTQIDSFFDVFTEIDLTLPGGTAIRESPTRQSQIRSTNNSGGLPPGEVVFDTEMLQLDLSGGTLPPGVMIRESPTLQSTGQTRLTDIGGGNYRIHSFFDVFTELSLDGGQQWFPSDGPLHLEGVPEPSTLTLAGLGLVACAAMAIRRVRRGR